MKLRFVTLALAVCVAAPGLSQRSIGVPELIRYERLSPQEAATIFALARGLNMDPRDVLAARRHVGKAAHFSGPAIAIAKKQRRDPRVIWQLKQRGYSWDELERARFSWRDDYWYGDGRYRGRALLDVDLNEILRQYGSGKASNAPRYDDRGNRIEEVIGEAIGEAFGKSGQRYDDPYYRYDDRYDYRYDRNNKEWRDREYERRFWTDMYRKAYSQNTDRIWSRVGNGINVDDVALACHVARVSRARVEDVAYEFLRTRNWNRVRETFGVSSDWATFDPRRGNRWDDWRDDRYNPWDDRYDPWGEPRQRISGPGGN